MFRNGWKIAMVGALLAVMLAAGEAKAQWWCDWGCYQPVCAVYYPATWCCYSCYYQPAGGYWYLGWRPGVIRRLLFGPYRWYYAGYGGWTWVCPTCYDLCCYDPCCVLSTTTTFEAPDTGAAPAGQTSTPAPAPTPAQPTTPAQPKQPAESTQSTLPTPPAGELPGLPGGTGSGLPPVPEDTTPTPSTMPPATETPSTGTPGLFPGLDSTPPSGLETQPATPPTTLPNSTRMPTPETSGQITIWVPPEAKVTINGLPTRSTGTRRQYVSYGLKPGYLYRYEIVAEMPCEVREVSVRFVRDENGEIYVDPITGQRILETVSDTREVKKLRLTRTVELVAGERQEVPFGNAFYRLTNLDTGETQVLALDRMLREDLEKVAAVKHSAAEDVPDWAK